MIEPATPALRLGTNMFRGYFIEIICADFFAGANLDNPDPLLHSLSHFFRYYQLSSGPYLSSRVLKGFGIDHGFDSYFRGMIEPQWQCWRLC
jgi:hypothetical protein